MNGVVGQYDICTEREKETCIHCYVISLLLKIFIMNREIKIMKEIR